MNIKKTAGSSSKAKTKKPKSKSKAVDAEKIDRFGEAPDEEIVMEDDLDIFDKEDEDLDDEYYNEEDDY